MTVTTLDPKTALILVDLQNGIVAYSTAHPMPDVVTHASQLAQAFRRHKLPVVLVNVTGAAPGRADQTRPSGDRPNDWADIIPELDQHPTDHTVTKRTWGAFTGTDLYAYLKDKGVTQVVLAGVATSVGVESTARHSHELGFNVTLALDAMTDMSAEAHDNSVQRIFPRLGESGNTRDIVAMLDQRNA